MNDGLGDGLSDGEALGLGELEGVGRTISAALMEADADGDALAAATGAAVGSRLMSYETFPRASRTFCGKFAGSGVSERCFITERTSGLKFGNTCSAPCAVTPALRVRISVRRLR